MKYRIGTHKDHADIEDCIASTGYYPDVNASLLDGTFVVAESESGQIVGCVWVMHYGRNAFVDYLAVRNTHQHLGIGIKLLAKLQSVLKRRGVRFVRANIHLSNTEAIRVGTAMGAVMHSPYVLCYADIGSQKGS